MNTSSGKTGRNPQSRDGRVRNRWRANTYDMDYFIWVLLISTHVSAYTSSYSSSYSNAYHPYNLGLERRRQVHPGYSNEFLDEYEPYAYAAIPIHAPTPVLHVLSPSNVPKYRPKKYTRPRVQQIQPEHYVYTQSNEHSQEQSQEHSPEEYSDSITRPKYASYYEDDAPVLVYARPNKNGGYTYRRPSASPTPSASTSSAHSREPFVVRIHKYRLVKNL